MRILFIIALLIFTQNAFAQKGGKILKVDKNELKLANEYLEDNDFVNAYDIYWSLYEEYPDNPDINFGVGVCKLNRRGEEKDALPFLQIARENQKNLEAIFYLGKALHLHHKFNEAISMYETYNSEGKGTIPTEVVNRELELSLNAVKMMESPRNVQVLNLGEKINTQYQESVPVILPNGNGMFFTSRRPDGVSDVKDYQGNYFQDIYFSGYSDDKGWQTPVNFKEFNSKTHDASVSISGNGSTFIMYRTNENLIGGDLYYSNLDKNGNWTSPVKFNDQINSMNQEFSAALSPDENTMIFSSNRPGGYGGFDLYIVKKLPNGNWAVPVNMGPNINTPYNEDAPFIFADGKTLYFSSTGHDGMGGFDVFKSTLNEQGIWTTPQNIGYPINTVEHDIYFVLQPDSKKAFYSSNRRGGFGGDDIYEIRMLDEDAYQSVVKLEVYDDSTQKPVTAKITLVDEKTHKLNGIYRTNSANGKCILVIVPEISYQLVIEASGYEPKIIYKSYIDDEDELNVVEHISLKKTGS